jgi:hypothetical protein
MDRLPSLSHATRCVKPKKIVDEVFFLWQGVQMEHAYRLSLSTLGLAVRVMGGSGVCVPTHFYSGNGGITYWLRPEVTPHTDRRTE